jgi:DNA-binding NtrC family response regulator
MTPFQKTFRKRHRVLLVDDEAPLLAALERALRREPLELLTARSAEEGLGLLGQTSVDAVVSDQWMPGMKGTEFLAEVNRLRPSTVRFMLTGQATLDVAVDAINKGAIHRFLVKPVDPADLVASLRQALLQKDLQDEARRLLHRAREQNAVLEAIEQKQPGITALRRDVTGAILLDDEPQDVDELLREISELLGEKAGGATV